MVHTPAAGWHIGVMGGSGLYAAGALDEAQQIDVHSAFGTPSAAVTTGLVGGVRFTFIPRHGPGHSLSPSAINYRANIDVMKRCGVTDLLSISAIGSLREDMAPGDFVLVDQFIDRTEGRARTFFDQGIVAHVPMADPTCSRLSELAGNAAEAAGAKVHRSGCYVAIEGPQFSTRAESRMYRQWGADVIGMTAMPEARLAREAELPYALLAMVTDYDSWRADGPPVDVAEILGVMRDNVKKARDTLSNLARLLPEQRAASPIDRTLDSAFITSPDKWDKLAALRLDAVAGRFLGSPES